MLRKLYQAQKVFLKQRFLEIKTRREERFRQNFYFIYTYSYKNLATYSSKQNHSWIF